MCKISIRHYIIKNHRYLSSLFPVKFLNDSIVDSYWYRERIIAEDIANNLGAKVKTMRIED